MAKIPFLYPRPLASGRFAWHWKPSPRLMREGWKSHHLGETDRKVPSADIVKAALEMNQAVEDFDSGQVQPALPAAPVPPRLYRWDDLVAAYRASPEFASTADSTKREYNTRFGQLRTWAADGQLYISHIDTRAVKDLKAAFAGHPWKGPALLRVLRMVLRWAVNEGILRTDPTAAITIPTPPSRDKRMGWHDVLACCATDPGNTIGTRYMRLAFWMMQRRSDMVDLSRFQWRQMHGADPRDVPVMANDRGEIWGFRLRQKKTNRWVDCPLPPFLHAEVEAAFAQSQWLFPHSQDNSRHMSGDIMRRRTKPLLVAGGFPTHQLRDLRRSGMAWAKDMGALASNVFAISGHPLLGQQRTMADTYMPPDTRAAIAAIAAAERTRQQLASKEESK